MKTQTILWTALPNGLKGGRLRLSVLVSPRLWTNDVPAGQLATLAPLFSELFLDWTTRSQKLVLSLKFEVGGPIPLAVKAERDPNAPQPDPKLWAALFKGTTPVRPYQSKNFTGRFIRSFPVRHVLSFLKSQYQTVATAAPTQFPSVQLLADQQNSFGQIAFDWQLFGQATRPVIPPGQRERQLAQQLNETLQRNRAAQGIPAILPAATPNPPLDFMQVKLFYRPLNKALPPVPGKRPQFTEYARVKPQIPKIDFHEMVASLGEYPELMRRLGLIIDLQVAYQPELLKASQVWVEPDPALPGAIPVSPKTQCKVTSGSFVATPRPGSDISNDMLKLYDPQKAPAAQVYDVVQVDVDGAALKTMNFASNVLRSLSSKYKTTDTPKAFSLPSLQTSGLSVIRTGRAGKLAEKFKIAFDDNEDVKNSKDVVLYKDDLVRGYRIDVFDGKSWHSLCKRVGHYHFVEADLVKDIPDEGWVSMGVTSAADKSSPDLYLHESIFRWAGWSLCAPRPGQNLNEKDEAVLYDDPTDKKKIAEKAKTDFKLVTFFEAAPKSLPRLRFGVNYRLRARVVDLAGNSPLLEDAGDSMATHPRPYLRFEPVSSPAMVLRKSVKQSPGESLERLVIRSYNDNPSKDKVPSGEIAERHFAPPLSSQLMAETHGRFDDTATGLMNKATYNTIADNEGTFAKAGAGEESLYPQAQLALPYLPDWLSRGAAFLNLPGAPPNTETVMHTDGKVEVKPLVPIEKPPLAITKVDFGTNAAWPEAKPFLIKVLEGAGEPKWDKDGRVLTVQLPKAEVARIRISSYLLDERDLDLMGVWQWIEEKKPENLDKLMRYALQGRHWMLTPFREMVLVHAVQQPLITPQFDNLKANRDFSDTFANLTDQMAISRKSTSKLDILAEWQEPIDALSKSSPEMVPGKAHAFEFPIDEPLDIPPDMKSRVEGRHHFRDTKYRKVNYTAVATTRFREYLPFSADEIESGKTLITRVSDKKTIDVLSSARPAAPKVLYVLPTFGWQREAKGTGIVSNRSGGGLRVYLERPWFSSGEGELLGVVLVPSTARAVGSIATISMAPNPNQLKPYVTQWGMDPIWDSKPLKARPSLEDCKKAAAKEAGLSLDELPGANVDVAGYAVEYDEDRRLWYCDIELEGGENYYPFVRLALARYQPHSIEKGGKDVKLSRVVLADFAQLAPDRSATISFDSDTKLRLLLLGPGPSGNEVEVSVEVRRPDIEDEDLGWAPASNAKVEPAAGPIRGGGRHWGITLSGPRQSSKYRLVIKEYESFLVDPLPLPVGPGGPRKGRRIVYADALELK